MVQVRSTLPLIHVYQNRVHYCPYPSATERPSALLATTMSSSKPLTLARINDLTLGVFANAPTSKTLEHAIRYLGTWSGSESVQSAPS